jgi:hypothetical protein
MMKIIQRATRKKNCQWRKNVSDLGSEEIEEEETDLVSRHRNSSRVPVREEALLILSGLVDLVDDVVALGDGLNEKPPPEGEGAALRLVRREEEGSMLVDGGFEGCAAGALEGKEDTKGGGGNKEDIPLNGNVSSPSSSTQVHLLLNNAYCSFISALATSFLAIASQASFLPAFSSASDGLLRCSVRKKRRASRRAKGRQGWKSPARAA